MPFGLETQDNAAIILPFIRPDVKPEVKVVVPLRAVGTIIPVLRLLYAAESRNMCALGQRGKQEGCREGIKL